MKIRMLWLLAALWPLFAQPQAHTNNWGCRNFKLPPRQPGESPRVRPDSPKICPVCQAEDDSKRKAEMARAEAETRKYKEDLLKERLSQQAAKDAREKDLANRNAVAMSKLQGLENEHRDLDQLYSAERSRRNEVNERFRQESEAEMKAYEAFLNNLQQVSTASVPASGDAFWNETISLADLDVFTDTKTGLMGYQNQQKAVVIAAKYQRALPIRGGVGAANLPSKGFTLIDHKGNPLQTINDDLLQPVAGSRLKISNVYPEATSEGLVIVSMYGKSPGNGSIGVYFGALDKSGKVVVRPLFTRIEEFKGGMAKADLEEKEWEKYEFTDTYSTRYWARFNFMERGLIDKKGNWIRKPEKVMAYSSGESEPNVIYVTSNDDDGLTSSERDAIREQYRLKERKAKEESRQKLDSEIQRRVSAAKQQGYLIETLNKE